MNDEPAGVMVTFDPAVFGFSVGEELIFGILVSTPMKSISWELPPVIRTT